MKINDRGFSLVELIISVAILGIVAVAAFGFMVAGTQGYSSVSSNVSLQYKSQLAMNHIQEYLIDCNVGVYFSDADDSLYIINSKTGAMGIVYTAHIFKYDSANKSIYYGENTATRVSTNEFTFSDAAPDLLTDGVSSFSVELSAPDGKHVSDVIVTIDFFVRNKTFTGEQTIALRNNPALMTVTRATGSATALTPP